MKLGLGNIQLECILITKGLLRVVKETIFTGTFVCGFEVLSSDIHEIFFTT